MPLTTEEREKFLAGPHIGALSVDSGEAGRAPLTVPIWYAYEPGGELWIITERDSRKARLIAAAGRFSLMADQVTPRVRYVSVEGEVVSTGPTTDEELRAMVGRYLAPEAAAAYLRDVAPTFGPEVTIRMRPRRWLSADMGPGE
ncbi:pyridoxamine 5'-phosphate oxidase family protein [Streptomyces rimosus]|uniref:pyridoxamine 5'-phosphate oxidase family protein n=1 Tax=Streptomyces TaxID=1883 RepID=UPI0005185905|nr:MULTISPECIES: pyridoxamine 5'-phosphate oxidase family protein [Streptomyces]KOT85376.1 pyridoxamine 5-phosphate oxidase [Streptomyces rimosus subsp. pseudoverticillatus]RSO24784.1 pyridoxamine 5-phosphate oxidase [Streptomyces sp. WAC 06725]